MNSLLWLCAAGAIGIFGVMLHSVATFRSADEARGRYRRRAMVEVVWALVPILIVVAAALPSFQRSESARVTIAASE